MKQIFRKVAARIITVILLSALLSGIFVNHVLSSGFFSDVPDNPLYTPHIDSLYNAHFITGDTVMGVPSGTFRPDATINRAEFTKITTIIRLAELYGITEKWSGKPELEILETVNDKLQYFYKCDNTDTSGCSLKKGADITNVCNVCNSIGGTPFSDVTEKEWGCEEKGICDPWFTQYVYYAVAKGFIKGDVKTHSFKPYNQILRIHALKMILSDNGTTDDERFKSLEDIADSRNSVSLKCLNGAEKYILDNNAGDNDLLQYALLADRLGLFGNDCSVFGNSTTPRQRADFLQKSLTRKEATRYYAFTTSYYPISADPGSAPKEDATTEAKEEVKTVTKNDTKTVNKTVEPKMETVVQTQESATPEKTLPDITISSSSGIALAYEDGRSCGTIPANTEFGLMVARKDSRDGKFYQYVDYKDLINCRFLCDSFMTPACRDVIALNGGIIEAKEEVASAYSDYIKSYSASVKEISVNTYDRKIAKYKELDNRLKSGEINVEQYCKIKNYKNYTEQLIVESWCKERWGERVDAMNKWMNDEFKKDRDAKDICIQALGGKEGKPSEISVVLEWCNKHGITEKNIEKKIKEKDAENGTDGQKPFSIIDEYGATGKVENWVKANTVNGVMVGLPIAPNMLLSDTLEQKFYIKAGGQIDPAKSNSNNTYIISHGWDSPYGQATGDNSWEAWTNQMAKNILKNEPNAQILILDWSKISNTATPFQAAKWIGPITDVTAEALKKWGINKDKTTVIGFSLGGLLTKELSDKLGGINIIALDPAASPFDYEIDFNNTTLTTFNNKGACIVADASWSGSETLMKTCREGYLIDYSGNPDFPLFTELYEYVDFIIDETVAEGLEYVVDKGFTYGIEKAANIKIGGRLRGVRMYKIMNGKLKEVFIENIEEKACDVINGTVKYLPYICEYGLKEIKDRFVTYHTNVHKVYDTLLANPFSESILSPQNFALRKGGSAPFTILDKGAHGIIYTERDNPYSIKYLKVLKTENSSRYTLYGNTQPNVFECNPGKDCEMYGGGGEDNFYHKIQPNSLYIEDFKANENDGDKIYLPDSYSDMTAKQDAPNKITILATYESKGGKTIKYVNIILENTNWSLGEVVGWADIATGRYRETEEGKKFNSEQWKAKKDDNPIQIKAK